MQKFVQTSAEKIDTDLKRDEKKGRDALRTRRRGALGAIFFTTDDCRETIEQFRERGVEITEEPSERPYGIDAGIRDPSGNEIRVTHAMPVPATP